MFTVPALRKDLVFWRVDRRIGLGGRRESSGLINWLAFLEGLQELKGRKDGMISISFSLY